MSAPTADRFKPGPGDLCPTCNKVCHPKPVAEQRAQQRRRRFEQRVGVYKCPCSPWWHFGTSPSYRRGKARRRSKR